MSHYSISEVINTYHINVDDSIYHHNHVSYEYKLQKLQKAKNLPSHINSLSKNDYIRKLSSIYNVSAAPIIKSNARRSSSSFVPSLFLHQADYNNSTEHRSASYKCQTLSNQVKNDLQKKERQQTHLKLQKLQQMSDVHRSNQQAKENSTSWCNNFNNFNNSSRPHTSGPFTGNLRPRTARFTPQNDVHRSNFSSAMRPQTSSPISRPRGRAAQGQTNNSRGKQREICLGNSRPFTALGSNYMDMAETEEEETGFVAADEQPDLSPEQPANLDHAHHPSHNELQKESSLPLSASTKQIEEEIYNEGHDYTETST
jgi:hypothetical protein